MASVTILDVAAAAGVSKTTASDALRGHGRVADATRDAVLSAAERLGYTLNRSARSLRTATTGAIGLCLPQVPLRSDYYLAFLQGVAKEAAAASYDVTLLFSQEAAAQGHSPHVDGFVVCDPRVDDPMIDRMLSSGLPVVTLERIPGERRATGMVWTDIETAAAGLLDELRAGGSRHPAMLSTTTTSQWPRDAESSYDAWCARTGVTPVRTAAPYDADADSLQRVVSQMLDAHPDVDSIVGVGDGLAARLASGITARGFTIGEDFLLASCSEQNPEPPLFAAVATNAAQAGRECTKLLFELMRGEASEGVERELEIDVRKVASQRL
ncbi:UNVERIFIED_CONTAM: LacI family transcriptional regulator [Microbacterium sp. SLM126]